MEALEEQREFLQVFIASVEYFVLLRPGGMIAKILADFPEVDRSVEMKLLPSGAVLRMEPDCIQHVLSATPKHACDDRFRLLVAAWAEKRKLY